ncbi:hypothetical protein HKD37_09G026589 [Glycine soja]
MTSKISVPKHVFSSTCRCSLPEPNPYPMPKETKGVTYLQWRQGGCRRMGGATVAGWFNLLRESLEGDAVSWERKC